MKKRPRHEPTSNPTKIWKNSFITPAISGRMAGILGGDTFLDFHENIGIPSISLWDCWKIKEKLWKNWGCLTHRIHVWYISLHLFDFYDKCIDKYSIHGSYGWGMLQNRLLIFLEKGVFFVFLERNASGERIDTHGTTASSRTARIPLDLSVIGVI